jgi:hypothetical protein
VCSPIETHADAESAPPQEEVLAVALAADDYDAEEERELTIRLGDTLHVLRKNEATGWWLGEVVDVAESDDEPRLGSRGWFPGDFCDIVE